MFDLPNAPAFLIKHLVIDYAANRQFGILFNRIILQVLVPSVAVNQVTPLRVMRPNAAAKRDSHGRGFDIQRFIVFNQTDGFVYVQVRCVGLDGFEEKAEADRIEECASLLQIWAVPKVENKSLQ